MCLKSRHSAHSVHPSVKSAEMLMPDRRPKHHGKGPRPISLEAPMKWVIVVAFACASSPAFGQSVLDDIQREESVAISYADLNLAQAKDVDRLVWRIKEAATAICFDGSREPLDIAIPDRACYNAAVSNGRREVDVAIAHRADASLLAAARVIIVRAK